MNTNELTLLIFWGMICELPRQFSTKSGIVEMKCS
jgi:hypothetical protein